MLFNIYTLNLKGLYIFYLFIKYFTLMTSAVGFEPTLPRLTAVCFAN